jgi:hypothetical protein
MEGNDDGYVPAAFTTVWGAFLKHCVGVHRHPVLVQWLSERTEGHWFIFRPRARLHGSVIEGLLLVLRQPMKTDCGRSHVWASNPVPNSGACHAHTPPRTRQPNVSKCAAGCSLQALLVNCAQTGSTCTVAGGWPARARAAVSTAQGHSSTRFKPQAGLNDKAYTQASSIHSLSPVVSFPNNAYSS